MTRVCAYKILIIHAVFFQRRFEPKRGLEGLDTVMGAISDHGRRRVRRDPIHGGDRPHFFQIRSAFDFIHAYFFARHNAEQNGGSQIAFPGVLVKP